MGQPLREKLKEAKQRPQGALQGPHRGAEKENRCVLGSQEGASRRN